MEIFQAIWTALTTESNLVMQLILIPLYFIEATVTIHLSDSLLNLNICKRKIICYILSLSIVTAISNVLFSDTLKVIISITFVPLFSVFVFKVSFFKGLLIEFLPMIEFMVKIVLDLLSIPSNNFILKLYFFANR